MEPKVGILWHHLKEPFLAPFGSADAPKAVTQVRVIKSSYIK